MKQIESMLNTAQEMVIAIKDGIRTDDLSRAAIQLTALGYLLEEIKKNAKEAHEEGDGA